MKKFITSLLSILLVSFFAVSGPLGMFEKKTQEEQTEQQVDPNGEQDLHLTKSEFIEEVKAINGTGEIGIPIVEIDIENGGFPQDKETYLNCSFKMTNTKNGEFDIDKPMQDTPKSAGGVGIRLRGNSTMQYPKKPFRIKFNEKTSLFGLTKNKSWVLLADYGYNGKHLLNYSAFTLAKHFNNLGWTPNPNHVALFVNGEFQGLYLLTEQVDENTGRAEVKGDFDPANDTEFPFLVEGFWLSDYEKMFEIGDGIGIEVKYPESEDCGDDYDKVLAYTQEYLSAMWLSLKTGEKVSVSFRANPVGFEDLVEVDSVVDFYLINEIMSNAEGGGRSVYMHKTATGKLKFGPLWDFDTQFLDGDVDSDGKKLLCAQHQLFFTTFLKNENYYDKVVARYNETRVYSAALYTEMLEHEELIKETALIDSRIWFGDYNTFAIGCEYVTKGLLQRRTRLDEAFALAHNEFVDLITK